MFFFSKRLNFYSLLNVSILRFNLFAKYTYSLIFKQLLNQSFFFNYLNFFFWLPFKINPNFSFSAVDGCWVSFLLKKKKTYKQLYCYLNDYLHFIFSWLNMHLSFFYYSLLGHREGIELIGYTRKGYYFLSKFYLTLGFSYLYKLQVPKAIAVKIVNKRLFRFYSCYYSCLRSFVLNFAKIFPINIYSGKGIFLKSLPMILKEKATRKK